MDELLKLQPDDIEDMQGTDLDNRFVEDNVGRHFDADYSWQTLQVVCDSFVRAFLVERSDEVSSLHCSLKECGDVLNDMEKVLQSFILQLDVIQQDIGGVRETLASTTTQLTNTRNAERVLWSATSQLVVPPEVVQVVMQSNEEQLGPQFQLCIRHLLRLLNYRVGTWRQGPITPLKPDAPRQREHRSESSTLREVRFSMMECRVYREMMVILDELTLYACIKIKAFLSKKLAVLIVKNTNVCIQQENALKPYAYFVQFLRSAAPLLRHSHNGSLPGEKQTTLIPYRIAKALYSEFKAEYRAIMSELYLTKLRDYVFTCNSLEYTTTGPPAKVGGGRSLLSGGSGAANAAPYTYQCPLVTDAKHATDAAQLQLGERGHIFYRVFAPPLIPTMEKASHRYHSYEETFRSLLSLTCDIATHEYIFTFQFFAGDMSMYVEVFKETLQFVVDYVSEVVLCRSSTGPVRQMLSERPRTSVNELASKDCYGLLIMIRLCHEYRALMIEQRKLTCLNSFFDSLLMLLWPAFRPTFERQLVALRCARPEQHLECTRSLKSVEDKLRVLHPLARSFTEFASVILDISLGTTPIASSSAVAPHREGEEGDDDYDDDGSDDDANEPSGKRTSQITSDHKSPSAEQSSQASPPSLSLGSFVDDGSGEASARLRRRALRRIAAEKESDLADSASRFSALLGTLSFMQVEVIHFLEGLASYILSHEAEPQPPERRKSLQMGFLLNNIYYMLQVTHAHSNSISFSGLAAGGGPEEDEEASDGRRYVSGSLTVLTEKYRQYRVAFVETVLRACFPSFCHVVDNPDTCTPQQVLDGAEHFTISWKVSLDALWRIVRRLIAEPQHEQEVIAQACMDLLLYNARFHTVVASTMKAHEDVFSGHAVRNLLVTNQQLLQYMRTFSTMAAPEQPLI